MCFYYVFYTFSHEYEIMELVDKTVNVKGASIRYIEQGHGEPFVLLHGSHYTADIWNGIGTLDAISKTGMLGIAVDYPGFGKSEKLDIGPGEFVLEFLESMHIKHTALLGASMGGHIALDFAVEHADMLDGLVLVGAVGVEDYRSKLGAISSKQVLLIWGDSDDVSPKSNYETMIDACPLSKFMNIGHRHACYRDDSASFNDAVAEFARSIKRQ